MSLEPARGKSTLGNRSMRLWGHTARNATHKEGLDAHTRAVADMTQELADKFDAGTLGYATGLLHDLGKAKPGFQEYLLGLRSSVPHSGDGAKFAAEHYAGPAEQVGRILAFIIAGHHAGLANGHVPGGGTAPLVERLKRADATLPWFDPADLPVIAQLPAPLAAAGADAFGWAFLIRMMFSTLVDADFVETERWFGEVDGAAIERGWPGHLVKLQAALKGHLAKFAEPEDALSQLRAEVLGDCRDAADSDTGLFTLTVPTGGGKTLSSLAFALDHAIRNDLDCVIYVIPFTSIVEQTASVFREALGDDRAILEHHSAFDFDAIKSNDDLDSADGQKQIRLAAQNWDRPIVITTAVQFFESLFANRTSRCRKLHNIARSVVVLDEAQTLPLPLLRPCLAALNELQRGYKTSVVLCTATQPALTREAGLKAPEALQKPTEIVKPGRDLFVRLKRVKAIDGGVLSDAELVAGLTSVRSGLVIVNRRSHARDLYKVLDDGGLEGACHLTTSMTAAHRQRVVQDIRCDLKNERPVRLVATSLIEAGVDISFAAVWRAWAGLDQIAQAAGRCNREGELGHEGGRLTVFEPADADSKPPRELETNAAAAQRVVRDGVDLLSKEAVAAYFRELLWTKDDGGRWQALDKRNATEAANFRRQGGRSFRQAGLRLCRWR